MCEARVARDEAREAWQGLWVALIALKELELYPYVEMGVTEGSNVLTSKPICSHCWCPE